MYSYCTEELYIENLDETISELFIQQSQLEKRISELETGLTDLKAQLTELRGTANPAHRPQKELSMEYIADQVKLGKSARTIAKMLNVVPNTIIFRLYKAGYKYHLGKWYLVSELPKTEPMSEEEKKVLYEKLKHLK